MLGHMLQDIKQFLPETICFNANYIFVFLSPVENLLLFTGFNYVLFSLIEKQ